MFIQFNSLKITKSIGQGIRITDLINTSYKITDKTQCHANWDRMLKKLFEKNDYIRLDEIDRTEKEIEKLKERITRLQDQFMDGNITPEDILFKKFRQKKR